MWPFVWSFNELLEGVSWPKMAVYVLLCLIFFCKLCNCVFPAFTQMPKPFGETIRVIMAQSSSIPVSSWKVSFSINVQWTLVSVCRKLYWHFVWLGYENPKYAQFHYFLGFRSSLTSVLLSTFTNFGARELTLIRYTGNQANFTLFREFVESWMGQITVNF